MAMVLPPVVAHCLLSPLFEFSVGGSGVMEET